MVAAMVNFALMMMLIFVDVWSEVRAREWVREVAGMEAAPS